MSATGQMFLPAGNTNPWADTTTVSSDLLYEYHCKVLFTLTEILPHQLILPENAPTLTQSHVSQMIPGPHNISY